ncbi:antitoxin [Campylobacter concisus]|uniref:antitoxin n=1 Tax=Campylobacter concisus TaxID=199 RepID=UPI00130DCE93|nr:AbrB/MazE/SpoVT family DNA-binding domain-containing protein [Campylobacter concisus]
MQARLKVFKSGNSLALRLPKSLNLDNVKEFILKSFDNNEVVLTPVKDDEWSGLFKTLNELKDAGVKFERAEQSLSQERNFGFK